MNANEAWDRVSANTLISSKEVCRHAPIFEGECHLPVVVKFVRADGVKEIEILKKLTHRNVIRLIESGLPQNGIPDHHYLALEKCHDKNLGQLVGSHRDNNYPFHLRYWWDIMEQIIYGVEYIHGMKIIHKDLKPENILLTPDEQTIKIADFGISEELKAVDETKSSIGEFGTAGYRPPESFESGTISLKSDIFSLGVVICFTLSYGGNPFGDDDMTQDYNIKKGIVIFPKLFVQNNETTEHLIRCMIRSELDDRPTIGQVLEHPCWTGREEKCDIDYRCPRKPKAPKANIRKKPMKFKVGRDEMLYEMKQRNWRSVPELSNDTRRRTGGTKVTFHGDVDAKTMITDAKNVHIDQRSFKGKRGKKTATADAKLTREERYQARKTRMEERRELLKLRVKENDNLTWGEKTRALEKRTELLDERSKELFKLRFEGRRAKEEEQKKGTKLDPGVNDSAKQPEANVTDVRPKGKPGFFRKIFGGRARRNVEASSVQGVAGQHLSKDQPSNTPSNQMSLRSSQTSTAKEATAGSQAIDRSVNAGHLYEGEAHVDTAGGSTAVSRIGTEH